MDPRNGEILALVSRPSFDPNAFAVRIERAEWNKLITDPDHPLMNKAIQAQLAPGSTFKILMSVAGLAGRRRAGSCKVNCAGGWGPYGFFHHCDEKHGAVDIHNAIPYSCDTFYYQLGDKLGIDRIAKYATLVRVRAEDRNRSAGRTGRADAVSAVADEELPSQVVSGRDARRCQSARERCRRRRCNWRASSAGLRRADTWFGRTSCFRISWSRRFHKDLLETLPGSGDVDIPIDPDNWVTITDGMAEVTQPGYFHTAGSAHLEGIDLAGKTGTAQVMSHEALAKTDKGMKTRPNVWFVGVTPRRNPELVVAVLWQNGEFSYYPARLGARVVSAYVEKQRRLANNLTPVKAPTPPPAEVGAVWTAPNSSPDGTAPAKVQSGHFFVGPSGIVDQKAATAQTSPGPRAPRAVAPSSRVASQASAVTPGGPWKPESEKKQ